MKTPHNINRGSDRNAHTSRSIATRRQRTLAVLGCESLEMKQLMTGFAGAGAMMPAEMGDMNRGGGDWNAPRFQRFNDVSASSTDSSGSAQGAATTDTGSTGAQDAGSDMMSAHQGRDFSRQDRGGDNFGGGRGGMGGDRGGVSADSMGGGDRGFGGRMGGGDQGMGDDQGNQPMATQTGSDASSTPSTGNTQLDTDFAKLQTDEQTIHDKSQVTPALEAAVRKDLQAINKAKTGTADATALKTLQTDEQTIFGTQTTSTSTSTDGSAPATPPTPVTLTDAQKATLQADHDAILKSEGVSQTLIDQLAADRLAVKTASNFTAADQATLDADHAAIKTDMAAAQSTATSTATGSDASTAATTATSTSSTSTADATATPDVTAAATSDASAAATPTTTASTDPTSTMTTSTATGGMEHHGFRSGMGERGFAMGRSERESFRGGSDSADAGSDVAHTESFSSSRGGEFMGHGGRDRRAMN